MRKDIFWEGTVNTPAKEQLWKVLEAWTARTHRKVTPLTRMGGDGYCLRPQEGSPRLARDAGSLPAGQRPSAGLHVEVTEPCFARMNVTAVRRERGGADGIGAAGEEMKDLGREGPKPRQGTGKKGICVPGTFRVKSREFGTGLDCT